MANQVSFTSNQIRGWLQQSNFALGANQFTFSVPTATSTWPSYAAGTQPFTDYAIPTSALATAFRAALALWDGYIAPGFTEVADNANTRGEVRIAFTSYNEAGDYGYAFQSPPQGPGTSTGDVWINSKYESESFQPGTYGFEAVLHELGHTLGLKHTFEAPSVPNGYDNVIYSLMSYNTTSNYAVAFSSPSANSVQSTYAGVYDVTPMVFDIAAVQAIYGADPATHAGADTYRFDQNAQTRQTIYDAGGTDTIDLSGFTRGSYLDLTPGAYSSLGQWSVSDQISYWSRQFSNFSSYVQSTYDNLTRQGFAAYTWTDNLGLSLSTVIENAIGGSGNDVIIGNGAANQLTGGLGNDLIDGGTGIDTAIFSGTHTAYKLVYQGGASARVSGPDGVDTLTGVERVQFADGTYAVPTSLFDPTAQASSSFGASTAAGGWSSQDRYARTMADVNGDGRADVIGFGEAGTYVALARADGSYGAATLATASFGRSAAAGGWDGFNTLPRLLGDVNGDGKADIVGFGNAGTYVALGRGDGSFGPLTLATTDFGRNASAGGWTSQDATPRLLGDVNGDGRADAIGFGNAGTYVALGRADGTFGPLTLATRDFGHDAGAGGWSSGDQFPRLVADVNGDGRADVIGFGNAGTYVALGRADGTFGALALATNDFGASAAAGGWSSAGMFPRVAGDVNGDGAADLVGFGNAGAYIALGDGAGHFGALSLAAAAQFGASAAGGGWTAQDLFPRMLADTDGDGRADLVGFGNAGLYTATAAAFDPVITTAGETREPDATPFDAAAFSGGGSDHGWMIADMPIAPHEPLAAALPIA